ncbi:hypothetical protein BHE74_00035099 [Ensete ventricosum]|nr:hypothetical protein BHE74_00035099 [Ensete ventricosum]RZR87061.1 hypothetical protein BHM03_00014377 [Ensete ventricosum]
MLRPGVTQEWVAEGELSREQIKNRRWRGPYDVLAEATHGEVVVRVHQRESICNGDVTRRRHGAANYGGINRGNATQAIVSLTTRRRAMDSRSECCVTAEAGLYVCIGACIG